MSPPETPADRQPDPSRRAADTASRVSAGNEVAASSATADKDIRQLADMVAVPRWVVYTQAALLGIVATSFFVFGLAVGGNTRLSIAPVKPADTMATLTGTVLFERNGVEQVDHGAVVMLLPVDVQPQTRPEPDTLSPDRFVPLDNPAIDVIRELGGAVVRADRVGHFEARVRGHRSYWLLVISRNLPDPGRTIDRRLRADLGAWFFPIETLLGDRAWEWQQIRITDGSTELPRIEFRASAPSIP